MDLVISRGRVPRALQPDGAPIAMRSLLFTLAGVQFAHVLDFIIVMPLGPQLMRELGMGPKAFGLLVSSYNLAAAAAGLIGAFVLDRFDRKTTLLVVFIGFTLGTFACALAEGATSLMLARLYTGAFGGLIQALVFAIIGDCFAEKNRGAATGTVMSAFSVASVIGIPIGLFLANHIGWRAPFVVLAGISVVGCFAVAKCLPPLCTHMSCGGSHGVSPLSTLLLAIERNSLLAFGLITSLMFAGFSVIPYVSTHLVANVGLAEKDLATVFLCGGVATFISSRVIGRLADRFGKLRVFTWLAALSTLPVLLLTHLPHVPLIAAVLVTTAFTVLISARAIPALAMITSSVEQSRRGRFLSLTSSVQQAASGIASLIAGTLLLQAPDGRLLRYDIAGYLAVVATVLAIFVARHMQPAPAAGAPGPVSRR